MTESTTAADRLRFAIDVSHAFDSFPLTKQEAHAALDEALAEAAKPYRDALERLVGEFDNGGWLSAFGSDGDRFESFSAVLREARALLVGVDTMGSEARALLRREDHDCLMPSACGVTGFWCANALRREVGE